MNKELSDIVPTTNDDELNELLLAGGADSHTATHFPSESTTQFGNNKQNIQWSTIDDTLFFPTSKTVPKLPPGYYEVKLAIDSRQPYFQKLKIDVDDILRFPHTPSESILKEIQDFWGMEERFLQNNMAYKRGIFIWGPPGSGKTCIVKLIMKDVVNRGGIVIKFTAPHLFVEGLRVLREIQPDVPVVAAMEDIEATLDIYDESELLNIIDGVEQVHKVVFLATTNYPEKLGARIVNRPSRFDTRFKVALPNAESRKMYFEFRAKMDGQKDIRWIEQWVKDTKGFSTAHLKELFVRVILFGKSYKDTLKSLHSMKDKIRSSDDEVVGFAGLVKFEENR